jgi:hypothetical protein
VGEKLKGKQYSRLIEEARRHEEMNTERREEDI